MKPKRQNCQDSNGRMNCTRALQTFVSNPQSTAMPFDLTMCFSLSQRRRLYHLISTKPSLHHYPPTDGPQRTSFHSSLSPALSLSSPSPSLKLRSCLHRKAGGLCKKRVVFADAKGLALTVVHLFFPDASSLTETHLIEACPEKLTESKKTQNHKYRLGFPQPTLDSKAFLARLQETNVQLESCNIFESCLSGKVLVCHGSPDKAVHLRLTFDSWQHYYDIPCAFLQQQRCGGSDVDVFNFDFNIPQDVNPMEGIEFCVSFRPGCGTSMHWDNNRGKNYKVHVDKNGGQSRNSLLKD
ncbi:protein phosphatase 1 regulatory subunit 3C-B [Syngnathoides biaculeatus]|uniref:protein phosphatase 1 regulatory subunit 3C-B n=1 Tax=Syngnathoides biaculeatus TaxID=300417 RepID=UPI002ADE07E7|nr:protein phosphatase 1 regulatory subunit 3C-B [Syngnathoides biaculeatus]